MRALWAWRRRRAAVSESERAAAHAKVDQQRRLREARRDRAEVDRAANVLSSWVQRGLEGPA